MFHESAARSSVPALLRIIAWFEIIGGFLALAAAFTLVAGAGTVLVLLSGLIALAAGWGLLKGKLWGYYAVLFLAGMNVLGSVVLMVRGGRPPLFSLAVNALILLILLNQRSRDWADSLRRR